MSLPYDIWCDVRLRLPLKDFVNFARVNRLFNIFYHLQPTWKFLYVSRWLKYATDNFIKENYDKDFDWKEMFKNRFLFEKETLASEKDVSGELLDEIFNLKNYHFYTFFRRCCFAVARIEENTMDDDREEMDAMLIVEECKSSLAIDNNITITPDGAQMLYYWGKNLTRIAVIRNNETSFKLLKKAESILLKTLEISHRQQNVINIFFILPDEHPVSNIGY